MGINTLETAAVFTTGRTLRQVAALLGEVVRSYTASCASLFEASARHLRSLGAETGGRQARSLASRVAERLPLPESAERVLRASPQVVSVTELLVDGGGTSGGGDVAVGS